LCFDFSCKKVILDEISRLSAAYPYVGVTYMAPAGEHEWKKGSAELLILSLLETQPRHGYEIGRLIDVRSGGTLHFHVASLYPLLYRLEKRGWIQGRWVERANQRRRRYYRLTTEGQGVLVEKRVKWREFAEAVGRIAGVEHA
jgi:PadR family transcriptional regulator, regulatory protein PadR